MDWLVAASIVILLAIVVYYALALSINLLILAGMVIGGAIKLLISPFRHRH